MVSSLRNRSAVSLIFLATLLMPAISRASSALDEWRVNNADTRALAREIGQSNCWLWSLLGSILFLLIISVYFLRRLQLANRKLSATSSQLEMMDFALNQARKAAYILDMDFRILYVNAEACRALGYSKAELLSMTMFDIDPFFRENLESIIANAKLHAGRIYIHEQKHRTRDGRIFPVEIQATLFEYQGKQLNISFARDISERKCMQAQLQESEARFRYNSHLLQSVLESSSRVGIYALDREYRYLAFNSLTRKGAKRLWGADIVIGMSMLDEAIDNDEHRAFCKQGFDYVLTGNSFEIESKEVRCKDGETIIEYHDNYASPIFDDNGKVIGLTVIVTNITERKRIEEALLASEKQFRSLAENTPNLILRYDRDCRRLYANPAVSHLSRKSSNELLGRSPDDGALLLGEGGEMLKKAIRRAFDSGEVITHWIDRSSMANIRHDYQMLLIPEHDEFGTVVTVLTVAHDITAIRDAEHRMSRFVAHVPGFANTYLQHADGKGRFPFASPGIFNIFGLQPEDVAQSAAPMVRMIHPDDRQLVDEAAIESWRTMLSCSCQYRINHPSKGERWLESFQTPEQTSEGLVQWHGMTFDITERKLAENSLVELNNQLRTIMHTMPDLVWLKNIEGVYLSCNQHFEKFFGAKEADILGKTDYDFVDTETADFFRQKDKEAIDYGSIRINEEWITYAEDQRKVLLETRKVPVYGEHGKVIGVMGIGRDITASKQAQIALEESRIQLRGLITQRETAREEERKLIARDVHDELGQILIGLKMNISVMGRKFAADSPPLREHVQRTMELIASAIHTVRDISSALRPVALDMGVVPAIKWQAGRFITFTGTPCEVHIEDEEMQLDENYAVVLFRIVQESFTNIAKHANASRVDITLKQEAGDYVLIVSDNGKGFATDAKKSGAFGLVGMRERTLMLGGTFTVNSRPGEGTALIVRVPVPEQNLAEEL